MNSLVLQTELAFATIEFFETYVVCKIKENAEIGIDRVVMMHKLYREHYGDKQYGYIFDRTLDSTIYPISYMQCPYYPDVTAFAMVAPTISTKNAVKFEDNFAKMKLHIFDTLDEAKDWMEEHNSQLGL